MEKKSSSIAHEFDALLIAQKSVKVRFTANPNTSWSTLQMEVVKQETDNWCWAATARSVGIYYDGSTKEQCEIATAQLGPDCCVEANKFDKRKCDKPWELEGPLTEVGHYNDPTKTGAATFQEIRREISSGGHNGNPLCFLANWNESDGTEKGHFSPITGYEPDDQLILFKDVKDKSRVIKAYAGFPGNYISGSRWSYSYFCQ